MMMCRVTRRQKISTRTNIQRWTRLPRCMNGRAVMGWMHTTQTRCYARKPDHVEKGGRRIQFKADTSPYVYTDRKHKRIDQNMIVLIGILVTNGIIYFLWKNAIFERDQRKIKSLIRNFSVSKENIEHFRVHTLITSAFSHRDGTHLIINCLALTIFGKAALETFGKRQFLAVYIGGAIFSALSHLLYRATIVPQLTASRMYTSDPNLYASYNDALRIAHAQQHDFPILGASGATTALMALYACVNPNQPLYLFGMTSLPLRAWLLVTASVAFDAYAAFKNDKSDNQGHAAHVAGALFGALYYLIRIRRRTL